MCGYSLSADVLTPPTRRRLLCAILPSVCTCGSYTPGPGGVSCLPFSILVPWKEVGRWFFLQAPPCGHTGTLCLKPCSPEATTSWGCSAGIKLMGHWVSLSICYRWKWFLCWGKLDFNRNKRLFPKLEMLCVRDVWEFFQKVVLFAWFCYVKLQACLLFLKIVCWLQAMFGCNPQCIQMRTSDEQRTGPLNAF